ncbi:MAG: phosphoribosylanthranilate isomerase [Proteobacteria bacterium]|nr:phosphoribosylanthranilate isomerase [Pseudomonadota bacterium]
MPVDAKICGLSSSASVEAAIAQGARYVGFVFFPPSPRHVTAEAAAALAALVPRNVGRVGVFVDPDDALLESVLDAAPLDILQLHGSETPARVADIRARFGLKVMKAIKVSDESDVARAFLYEDAADMLLFDARPPAGDSDALPGGNGIAFDRLLVRNGGWSLPWMLSGGLDAATLGAAVAASGAAIVDVSSGVEDAPGEKNVDKIRVFLECAAGLSQDQTGDKDRGQDNG